MFRLLLAPRFVVVVLLLLGVPLLGETPSAAVQKPLVYLSPTLLVVPVGETACADLRIENVENLFGFATAIRFDPNRVAVVDADPDNSGIQIEVGPFLQGGFVASNSADNAGGTISLGITLFGAETGRSGSGTLATICFRGLNRGHSAITLVDAGTMLLDPNVSSIPFTIKSGGSFVGPVFRFRIPLVVRGQ